MTREEAKKRLEVRLICANCPEDKMCYDSHLHSICEYTDYCDEVPIEEAVKVAIEALEQQPCDKCVYSTSEGCQYDDITETIPPFDDCISRQAVLDGLANIAKAKARSDAQKALMGRVMFFTEKLPSVNPQKPKSEWQHDHEILKAYSDGANAVLDKIRDEIREQSRMHMDGDLYIKTSSCMQIINDYMAEEDKE